MAGGAPFSSFNRFTLYTPNSVAIIQGFLESKAVFDASSPTGFSKWNVAQNTMEPYSHKIDYASQITAPVSDLSEAKLTTFLAKFDRINVAMGDGNWTKEIHVPPAAAANQARTVAINHGASYSSILFLNGKEIAVDRGFNKSYISDGTQWIEGAGQTSRSIASHWSLAYRSRR